MKLDLTNLPNFCAHEHWGSLLPFGFPSPSPLGIGFRADRERGAQPERSVGLLDILIDPYFGGQMAAAGIKKETLAQHDGQQTFDAWIQSAPEAALNALRPGIKAQCMTGTFQCLRRGIKKLYGAELNDVIAGKGFVELNRAVAKNYEHTFAWYQAVMRDMHFSRLIRPMEPEFYASADSTPSAQEEMSFTQPLMRIDPLVELWKNSPRREALVNFTGIDPADESSWRAFIVKLFDLAEAGGVRGIKQAQAYRRNLNFISRDAENIVWRGDLTDEQASAFEDWIVHECCRLANERDWPHQIHVGTTNLSHSIPLPLANLAMKYRRMKLVLIHCWPFIDEAGWLARIHPNVYLDACWLPILNPVFFTQALDTWLNYVPAGKIMLSHDATSPEMAAGSSLIVRERLADAISRNSSGLGLSRNELEGMAGDMLHNTAATVYGTGKVKSESIQ